MNPGKNVRQTHKAIMLLLLCVGGCAGQREPTADKDVIQAGSEAQKLGIAGYRIGRRADTAYITLVDATGTSKGRLVVQGSASTVDNEISVSTPGASLHLRLDDKDFTKQIQREWALHHRQRQGWLRRHDRDLDR
jgi:hypothetical protein